MDNALLVDQSDLIAIFIVSPQVAYGTSPRRDQYAKRIAPDVSTPI
jgi:hypothetical protein